MTLLTLLHPSSAPGGGGVGVFLLVSGLPTANLSGDTTFSGAPAVTYAVVLALSGSSDISAAPKLTLAASAPLSATSGLTATATVAYHPTAPLSGDGSLTANPKVTFQGSTALSGSGTLTAAPKVTYAAASPLSGLGTLLALIDSIVQGAASLSGNGSLSANGTVFRQSPATLSGDSSTQANASIRYAGVSTLGGQGSLTASYGIVVQGTALLTGEGVLAAGSEIVIHSAAVLSAEGGVNAAGSVASLTVEAILSGTGSMQIAVGQVIALSATLIGDSNLRFSFDSGRLSGIGSLRAKGKTFRACGTGPIIVTKYMGTKNVPQDVRRRRHQVYDAMRRLGSPILIKHMFNVDDVTAGIAEASPSLDHIYKQVRNEDPYSHGVGYVSIEKSPCEWIDPEGTLVISDGSPGEEYTQAPKYRGYGPGYLTYVIQPDIAQDFFKVTETGAFIKVQTATCQAPWYPAMNDNDLMINLVLDDTGNIVDTLERFQLKMTNPISFRGLDRKGRREYTEAGGNRHVMNQQFEMVLVPENNVLYAVETDR